MRADSLGCPSGLSGRQGFSQLGQSHAQYVQAPHEHFLIAAAHGLLHAGLHTVQSNRPRSGSSRHPPLACTRASGGCHPTKGRSPMWGNGPNDAMPEACTLTSCGKAPPPPLKNRHRNTSSRAPLGAHEWRADQRRSFGGARPSAHARSTAGLRTHPRWPARDRPASSPPEPAVGRRRPVARRARRRPPLAPGRRVPPAPSLWG